MSHYSKNKIVDDPNHVWNRLADRIHDGASVLDIGCSSGNFGESLIRAKQCSVDGIEIDTLDAKRASKKLGTVWNFSIEEPENFKKITKRYDVIVFADVLEHLVNPSNVLKAIKPLLKPRGCVVFSIPNMAHISIRLSLLGGEFAYTDTGLLDKTHLHFYDEHSIKTVFSEALMHITDIDGVIYGYPDELIKRKLKKLGFTSNEKGMKLLKDPRAAIFQFVGSAEYGTEPNAKVDSTMPVLSRDIQELVDQSNRKDAELATAYADIGELHHQLNAVKTSRTYKLASVFTKLPIAIKRALTKVK